MYTVWVHGALGECRNINIGKNNYTHREYGAVLDVLNLSFVSHPSTDKKHKFIVMTGT